MNEAETDFWTRVYVAILKEGLNATLHWKTESERKGAIDWADLQSTAQSAADRAVGDLRNSELQDNEN